MEMTPLQIASEYRTGKDKSKTIKVLAELNLVSQRTIAQILDEQGEALPGHWKEKLATPLKRPPKERIATAAAACHDKEGAVTPGELAETIVEAVTPEDEERIATPACAPVRNDTAALSQDESRQAAADTRRDTSSGAAAPLRSAPLPPGKPATGSFPHGESPLGEGRENVGISWAQFSRLQLLIGRLEGMSPGPPTGIGTFYDDTVRQLADLADELRPTV